MNKTKIEWADYTWNPITGCSKVSEGCKNCYAHGIAKRFSGGDFSIKFHPERLKELETVKNRSKIFVCSMSDFFHINIQKVQRYSVMAEIEKYPQHKYLFLTKRPELIPWGEDCFEDDNVWIGTSVENQECAYHRIEMLLSSTVSHRFLSVEPMLGSVDIGAFLATGKIDWVICGPETGAGARPFEYPWAAALWAQCEKYKVPFFFKGNDRIKSWQRALPMDWPEGLKIKGEK